MEFCRRLSGVTAAIRPVKNIDRDASKLWQFDATWVPASMVGFQEGLIQILKESTKDF